MSDQPRQESIDFLRDVVLNHSKVEELTEINSQVYEIYRIYEDKLIVYFTNLYTVGLADYIDIRKRYPNVNCIVTSSSWNKYTRDAKRRAVSDNVGLFTIGELLGAINVQRFWEYVKKDKGYRKRKYS